jgi:hypothetical protein
LLSFSGIHTKHKRALFGHNVEFLKLKLRDLYSNVWALKSYHNDLELLSCLKLRALLELLTFSVLGGIPRQNPQTKWFMTKKCWLASLCPRRDSNPLHMGLRR